MQWLKGKISKSIPRIQLLLTKLSPMQLFELELYIERVCVSPAEQRGDYENPEVSQDAACRGYFLMFYVRDKNTYNRIDEKEKRERYCLYLWRVKIEIIFFDENNSLPQSDLEMLRR